MPSGRLAFTLALLGLGSAVAPVVGAPQPVSQLRAAAPGRLRPAQGAEGQNTEGIVHFKIRSQLLSDYWGRDQFLEAGVVEPPADRVTQPPPVCYSVHGFGGSHRSAWFMGPRLREQMIRGDYPPMLYVFLNAGCPLGHHEFADSVNNGPWGQALTEELIPALEKKFGAAGRPGARFVTGHSSGGWSSLWLQITYPDQFGGTWSIAPDPVDFRDFTGIDIYRYPNAFVDPQGEKIMLVRSRGEWVMSIEEFVKKEFQRRSYGGQFASFNAVFSPRADDGTPMRLFDVKTGVLDPLVASAWQKYDISRILRSRWSELGPKLKRKLHVYVGTQDTFRLDGAVRLLQEELTKLGSDAEIVVVEGRDHGTILRPEPKRWPDGLIEHVHRQMWDRFQETTGKDAGRHR